MASINFEGVLKPKAKSHGGVHTAHHKNTASQATERFPVPDKVSLPMSMHIGAPCTPTVKVGEEVKVGQLVGDTDAFVSAPIYASISGKVSSLKPVKVATGKMIPAVTIESDGKMELYEGLTPPEVDTREKMLAAIRKSGLVGLGGAGFPTHVKFAFKEDAGVDTLIINAAECEPYITVDHRECLDHTESVLYGLEKLQNVFSFKHIYIAIEDNKSNAFRSFGEALKNSAIENVAELVVLPSQYPQGAEKVLIYSVTGKQVPPGKLPADVGCVVMNIQSISTLGRFFKTGKPLVSRSLTIDGTAIKEAKNLRVPLGTQVKEIIDYCGGFKGEPYKVLFGGPMMGFALEDLEIPVLKNNNAILAFSKEAAKIKKTRACIRCGRCVQACPMSLEPTYLEKMVHLKDADRLNDAGIMVCMECGSCAYACPSGRPLVQYMRLGKSLVREAGAK